MFKVLCQEPRGGPRRGVCWGQGWGSPSQAEGGWHPAQVGGGGWLPSSPRSSLCLCPSCSTLTAYGEAVQEAEANAQDLLEES